MNKSKIKLLFVLNCLLAGTLSAKSDILSENIRDYRTTVDEVITQFVSTGQAPTIDQALRIQSCENDMLALARLDPSVADSMPELLLANHVRLQDLRHMPGELVVGRAKIAGVHVLVPNLGNREIEYVKGTIFPRTRKFVAPPPSSEFPARDDWMAQYAYALHCLDAGEYEQAAEHFEKAVPIRHAKKGTKSQVWEFENLVSCAWSHLLAGSPHKAGQLLSMSSKLVVDAPPSKRARYLKAVLSGESDPSLGMALNHSLAQR
jgi:hypothetical protein